MIETPERVIRFLRRLDASNYLDVKFAFMPSSQWQKVVEAMPESVSLIARVWLLPDGILEEFAASGDIRLRRLVAMRPRLPAHVQALLVRDPAATVRFRLARGRGALRSILMELAGDSDPLIARAAARRLARGEGRADDRYRRRRSRRHWGPARYPESAARGLSEETWAEALREQARDCERRYPSQVPHWPVVT
jgi:uncharacterized protein (DUF2336 family)